MSNTAPPPNDATTASYRRCRAAVRASGSNFAWAFVILPADQRRAMHAVYAFLRHTDDLADDETVPLPRRRERLAAWGERLNAWGAGPEAAADTDSLAEALWPALRDAAERFAIPREHFREVVRGAEMDLAGREPRSLDDLLDYCRHVAGAVGLICLRIWGCRDEAAHGPAVQYGHALQLTNILRDIGEDLANGRVYLPAEWLAAEGLTRADLATAGRDERLGRVVLRLVRTARGAFAAGEELRRRLPFAARCCLDLMVTFYRELLDRLEARCRAGGDLLGQRLRLSRFTKLRLAAWVLAENLLGRGRLRSPTPVPPADVPRDVRPSPDPAGR